MTDSSLHQFALSKVVPAEIGDRMKDSPLATAKQACLEIAPIPVRLAAIFALALCLAQEPARAQQDRFTKYEWMIPMRDGTRLYTAVFVPKNRTDRHPILLERTGVGAGPYGPDKYRRHRGSPKFVENGYIFSDQDVRGVC